MRHFSKYYLYPLFILSAFSLTACAKGPLPFASDPYVISTATGAPDPSSFTSTVVSDRNEIEQILQTTYADASNINNNKQHRKDFITLKMYLIDKVYFNYERVLTNEDTFVNSLGTVGSMASNAVAATIPAGQATKILAAVAGGLTGTTSLYDQKVLLTQTIQALLVEMRTDRANQAAQIYARMSCKQYPLGMIYSDLEAYARAGTFEAAVQGLTKTVSQAHDAAQDGKNVAASGAAAGSNTAKLLANTVISISNAASCPLDQTL